MLKQYIACIRHTCRYKVKSSIYYQALSQEENVAFVDQNRGFQAHASRYVPDDVKTNEIQSYNEPITGSIALNTDSKELLNRVKLKIPHVVDPSKPKPTVLPVIRPKRTPAETLHQEMSALRSVDEVLEEVHKHNKQMDEDHFSLSLSNLCHQLRYGNSSMSLEELKQDTRFHLIIINLARMAQAFPSAYTIVTIIKNLHFLEYDSRTQIMQLYLQLMKHHINSVQLTPPVIVQLGDILTQLSPTRDVQILIQCLAEKTNILHNKIGMLNIRQMGKLIRIFNMHLNGVVLKRIISCFMLKRDEIELSCALNIVHGLTHMDTINSTLLRLCTDVILTNHETLSVKDTVEVIRNYVVLDYYDEYLFSHLTKHIAQPEDVDFKQLLESFSLLLSVNYYSGNLEEKLLKHLDSINSVVVKESEVLDFTRAVVSMATYNPSMITVVQEKWYPCIEGAMNKLSREDQLYIALHLVALNIYPHDLIRSLVESCANDVSTDTQLLLHAVKQNCSDNYLQHVAARLLASGDRPCDDSQEPKNEHMQSIRAHIDDSLYNVRCNIQDHNMHIDMEIENKLTYARTAVLVLDQDDAFRNNSRPTPITALRKQLLESYGNTVVTINIDYYVKVLEDEREYYIQDEVFPR